MSARYLARRLIGHALWVMPPAHRAWVRAMQVELDHIPAILPASLFALGCVRASYTQRIVDMITLALISRWTLGGLALAWAGFCALAATLLIAVKSNPGVTPTDLGSDPGAEETLRFVQAYPTWELAVFVLIAVLLIAGAVQLVRRRRTALPLLGLGVGAATVLALVDLGAGIERPMTSPGSILIPLLCLPVVWWLSHRAADLKTSV